MLEMALVGYQHEREKLVGRIQELQALLKGTHAAPVKSAAKPAKSAGGKRVVSPAARRRMAAAQKKRWAEHHKRLASAQS